MRPNGHRQGGRGQQFATALDYVNDRLLRMDRVEEAISWLITELEQIREASSPSEWEALCAQGVTHPLHRHLLEDPYTSRAFYKPRGYAGDAGMIDFLYFGRPPETTSELGRRIFAATTGSTNGESVRKRARRFASVIDSAYDAHAHPKILAMACGHLRELAMTRRYSVGSPFPGFFAFDQDKESLAVVRRDYHGRDIVISATSVGGILRGKLGETGFTLIYAAGLYDYLSDEVAATLTRVFVSLLAVGGHLIVANFMPDNDGRGYMEACMAWKLICRGEQAMLKIVEASTDPERHTFELAIDDEKNVVYLTIFNNPHLA